MQLNAKRFEALDALRGLAIGGMLFSGLLPYGVLPGWMYHAQNPPPAHAFNPGLPGISWVDLVFPLFLFALGAALPFSLSRALAAARAACTGRAPGAGRLRRIAMWRAELAVAGGTVRRAVLMMLFAVYVRHISPHVVRLGDGALEACYALAGFALLFPMLAGLPSRWPRAARLGVRCAAWAAAAALMLCFRDAKGAGFSLARSDIIMLVLANVSLGAGLLWQATRSRPQWRWLVLGLLLALRLGHGEPGWAQWLWQASPLPALVNVAFQQYLFIVIPGTFAGDLLLRLGRRAAPAPAMRFDAAALACCAMLAALLVGLYSRHWLLAALPCAVLMPLALRCLRAAGVPELRRLLALAAVMLLFGLALEPYEGGIQKGRATLSFYFVGAGASLLVLVALHVLIEIRGMARPFALWTGAGRNPLIAYAGVQCLLVPLLSLSGLGAAISAATVHPALGLARALAYTLLLCAFAGWCARRRVQLRL